MPRSHAIVLGVAAFIFGALTLFIFRQNVLLQALSFLALLAGIPAFIAGIVFIVTKGGFKKTTYYLPLCAVVAAFVAGPRFGDFLRKAYFSTHLSELQEFALTARDSSPRDGIKWKDVYTSAGTTKSGHRYVFFWWGGGFPVKHTVLAYHSGNAEEAAADFRGEWRGREFRDHWHILSD
jgi:hypothetical protein